MRSPSLSISRVIRFDENSLRILWDNIFCLSKDHTFPLCFVFPLFFRPHYAKPKFSFSKSLISNNVFFFVALSLIISWEKRKMLVILVGFSVLLLIGAIVLLACWWTAFDLVPLWLREKVECGIWKGDGVGGFVRGSSCRRRRYREKIHEKEWKGDVRGWWTLRESFPWETVSTLDLS